MNGQVSDSKEDYEEENDSSGDDEKTSEDTVEKTLIFQDQIIRNCVFK